MFLLNIHGKEPIFVQIKQQIINYIILGVLEADEKLPSVRSLAEELGINPNTVQKSYSDLEAAGYIYTISKKGVFVSKHVNLKDKEKKRLEAKKHLQAIYELKINKNDLFKMIEEVYDDRD